MNSHLEVNTNTGTDIAAYGVRLRVKFVKSFSVLLWAQFKHADWIRCWQTFTDLALAIFIGSMFHIVINPKQNLRNTSVWSPCCTKSLNCKSCLALLLGSDLSICRGDNAEKTFGAKLCVILYRRLSINMFRRTGTGARLND